MWWKRPCVLKCCLEKQAFVLFWKRKPLQFSAHQCLYSFLLKGVVSDPGWVWSVLEGAHLTFQSDDCGAVEVQQGGQGTAVCVVLQQILHQGERRSAPLLSVLFPIARLKPWQQQRYHLYVSSRWIRTVWLSQRDFFLMCMHRSAHTARDHTRQTGVNQDFRMGFRVTLNNAEVKMPQNNRFNNAIEKVQFNHRGSNQ